MKLEELVAMGIGEEAAQKALAAWQEEMKGFIPKSRFDEVNAARKAAEDAVKARDGQIEQLRTASATADELKKQIEQLQADNRQKDEQHAQEMTRLRIDNAVDAALTAAKAKNLTAAKALLNLSEAKLDDSGAVIGLDAQIRALVQGADTGFMFDSGAPELKGARTGEQGVERGDFKADTSKMTYDELCEYLAANPDAKL